jgi:hypothetical protein
VHIVTFWTEAVTEQAVQVGNTVPHTYSEYAQCGVWMQLSKLTEDFLWFPSAS